MATPTFVTSAISTTSAQASVQVAASTAQVGDLAVLIGWGTPTALSTTTVDYSGGSDAGWTYLSPGPDGSGTNRMRVWMKVLTAADFFGAQMFGVGPHSWANSGSSRMGILIFRHARGWDLTRVTYQQTTPGVNTTNSTTLFTLANPSPDQACIALAGILGSSVATAAWDGGGFAAAALGSNGGAVDYKLHDQSGTPSAIAWNANQNNTTHASWAAVLSVAIPGVSPAVSTTTIPAVGRKKSRSTGTAPVETDVGVAIVAPPHGGTIAVSPASSTSTVPAVIERRTAHPTAATEADISQAMIARRLRVVIPGTEADVAPAPSSIFKTSTLVVELAAPPTLAAYIDATLHAIVRKVLSGDAADVRLTLLQGTDPNTATVLGQGSWIALTATATDYAVVCSPPTNARQLLAKLEIRTTLGAQPIVDQVWADLTAGPAPTAEHDTGVAVTRGGRGLGTGPGTEGDTGQPVGHAKRRTVVPGVEDDEGRGALTAHQKAVGTAEEADVAVPPIGGHRVGMGPATEADQGGSTSRTRTIGVGTAGEVDHAGDATIGVRGRGVTLTADDEPHRLTYLAGSSGPGAVLRCPDGGDLDGFASVVVIVAAHYPGGDVLFTIDTGLTLTGTTVSVEWGSGTIDTLLAGEYGLTVVATTGDGQVFKWRGLLAIEPSN